MPSAVEAERQTALTDEPVRQVERLAGVAEADAAAADQKPHGQIEVPDLRGERRQQQAAGHQQHPAFHHHARPEPIHHAADQRAKDGGDDKAERERSCREAAFPVKFIDDRRKEQREGRARIHADGHRHEGDDHDHPAVEEARAHGSAILSKSVTKRHPSKLRLHPRTRCPTRNAIHQKRFAPSASSPRRRDP